MKHSQFNKIQLIWEEKHLEEMNKFQCYSWTPENYIKQIIFLPKKAI